MSNVEDLNNLWVTINAQTGLVNTEPVRPTRRRGSSAYNSTTGDANDKLLAAKIAAMNAARAGHAGDGNGRKVT